MIASLPWRSVMSPRADDYHSLLDSALSSSLTPDDNSKRFCADYEPSSEALVSQYRLLSSLQDNQVVIQAKKDSKKKEVALYAQKSFERDQLITEYIGNIRPFNKDQVNTQLLR